MLEEKEKEEKVEEEEEEVGRAVFNLWYLCRTVANKTKLGLRGSG